MSERTLFGDPSRSPLWAVVLGGDTESAGIEVPAGMVAIVVVTEGAITWADSDGGGGNFSKLSASALLTKRHPVSLGLSHEGDATVVAFAREVFDSLVGPFASDLIPELARILTDREGEKAAVNCSLLAPFVLFSRIVPELQEVPASVASGSFWFEGQIRLLLSQTCFQNGGKVESRGGIQQLGKSLKRINRAKRILKERPEDSLDLSGLADEVGCSSSYLSRTFSQLTGMTVSQYLRRARIALAGRMLELGEKSVSEVALAVGYQSLSHFTKAFHTEKGCLPSRFMTPS